MQYLHYEHKVQINQYFYLKHVDIYQIIEIIGIDFVWLGNLFGKILNCKPDVSIIDVFELLSIIEK
jgi:hypothetical protein